MSNLVTLGIVLALVGIVAYISRKLGAADADSEREKATSRDLQEVADAKITALQTAELQQENELRDQERVELSTARENEGGLPRTSIGFYPARLRRHPKDPDDLN